MEMLPHLPASVNPTDARCLIIKDTRAKSRENAKDALCLIKEHALCTTKPHRQTAAMLDPQHKDFNVVLCSASLPHPPIPAPASTSGIPNALATRPTKPPQARRHRQAQCESQAKPEKPHAFPLAHPHSHPHHTSTSRERDKSGQLSHGIFPVRLPTQREYLQRVHQVPIVKEPSRLAT